VKEKIGGMKGDEIAMRFIELFANVTIISKDRLTEKSEIQT
jgi:hypothetical protein